MSSQPEKLRASVTLEQRALMDQIWNSFMRSKPHVWPSAKSIHLRSSKPTVQGLLANLPPGAMLFTADDRYSLSLLGLLLTMHGEVLDSIFIDFLEWLRREAIRNPDIDKISSTLVRGDLRDISDDESHLLGQAIYLGGFWDQSGSFNGPTWECGVPDDIDELPGVTDLRTYFWDRAQSRALAAAQNSRVPFVPASSTQQATATTATAPSAFLSYSWDDDNHRAWVRALAERLRRDGVDAKLDQWETVPGDQLPSYMEQAIRDNDYVLIICTPRYGRRSEARAGGVGYEGDIITAEIFIKGNHRKFIPILAGGIWDEAAPSWLRGKYRVDLSGRPYSDESYQDLLTTIHHKRLVPPPVGRPFSTVSPAITTTPASATTSSPRASEDIRIEGVIVDEVTEPRRDGSRGSALYAVPFRLSARPAQAWARLFVENWNQPPRFTQMHRRGIASVHADKIILDGTTLEEVYEYHRDTLKLVLAETNRQYRDHVEQERAPEEARRRLGEEHRKNIEEQARRIRFDE